MDQQQFDRIKNSPYAPVVSFALWDVDDMTNVGVIEGNISQLTTTIAIVGLNGAGESPDGPTIWGSYHLKRRGCKDYYLCEAFQKQSRRFTGAYMTDLVKDSKSKNQKDVVVEPRHMEDFIQELTFIGMCSAPFPLIIALGDKVYEALTARTITSIGGKTFLEEIQLQWQRKVDVLKVSHHARKGYTRAQFCSEVSDLEKQLDSNEENRR